MIEDSAYFRTQVCYQLRLAVAHKKLELLYSRVEDLVNTFEKFESLKPEERIAGIAQSVSFLKATYYELLNTATSLHK